MINNIVFDLKRLSLVAFITITILQQSLAQTTDFLDKTFGDDGIAQTTISVSPDQEARSLTIQPDGKIIVVGKINDVSGAHYDMGVLRYNSDGSLDKTFNEDGIVRTDFFDSKNQSANSVALQSNGRIVVVGRINSGNNEDYNFGLARYNADGSLDETFNNNGVITTNVSDFEQEAARAVAIQKDGKIIVAGIIGSGSNQRSAYGIVRYRTNGDLDTNFGNKGVVRTTTSTSRIEGATAVKIQDDGKIVVAGNSRSDSGSDHNFGVIRYNIDGSLDKSFDFNGISTTDITNSQQETATDLTLQPDGKIIVVGKIKGSSDSDHDFGMIRYNTNGSLDKSFGDNGIVKVNIGNSPDEGATAVSLRNNKIIVVGKTGNNDGTDSNFGVLCFNENGSLNENFGNKGIIITDITSSKNEGASAVAIQADGKIVVSGTTYDENSKSQSFAVARYAMCKDTKSSVSILTCDKYIVPSGDETYTESGSYFDTIPNSLGCDSVIEINLTINISSKSEFEVSTCSRYTVPSGDETHTKSGIYFDTIPNSVGCDSILKINLTIEEGGSAVNNISASACKNYTVPSGDETYTESGTYFDTIPNQEGCDSILKISLTIQNISTTTEVSISACDQYTVPSGDETYLKSGTYKDTLTGITGCDSLLIIKLYIRKSTKGTQTTTACNSYTWPVNGITYSASGSYIGKLSNSAQCDSVITLSLTIKSIDTSVNNIKNLLFTNAVAESYQWLYCDSNYKPVSNAINQYYEATINGNYAVIVTNNGCSDTSNCHMVNSLSIDSKIIGGVIKVYPSPTKGDVTIDLGSISRKTQLKVRSIAGQLLMTRNYSLADKLDLRINGSPGFYILEIETDLGNVARIKILKD